MNQVIKFFVLAILFTTLNGCYILLGPANGGVEVPVYQVPPSPPYRGAYAPRVNPNGRQLGPSYSAQFRRGARPPVVVVMPRPVRTLVRPPEAQRQTDPAAKYKRSWTEESGTPADLERGWDEEKTPQSKPRPAPRTKSARPPR